MYVDVWINTENSQALNKQFKKVLYPKFYYVQKFLFLHFCILQLKKAF